MVPLLCFPPKIKCSWASFSGSLGALIWVVFVGLCWVPGRHLGVLSGSLFHSLGSNLESAGGPRDLFELFHGPLALFP